MGRGPLTAASLALPPARRLKEINAKCPQQLKAYYECMDYYTNKFTKCRKEQMAFEDMCPP